MYTFESVLAPQTGRKWPSRTVLRIFCRGFHFFFPRPAANLPTQPLVGLSNPKTPLRWWFLQSCLSMFLWAQRGVILWCLSLKTHNSQCSHKQSLTNKILQTLQLKLLNLFMQNPVSPLHCVLFFFSHTSMTTNMLDISTILRRLLPPSNC